MEHNLAINDKLSLLFKKRVDDYDYGWHTLYPYKGEEVELNFNVSDFHRHEYNNDSPWNHDYVIPYIEDAINKLDEFHSKSIAILTPFYNTVFHDSTPFEKTNSYFNLLGIEINEDEIIELQFWISSKKMELLDPYFSYKVRFQKVAGDLYSLHSVERSA